MILIPGAPSFAKLVMMSSTPAKSAGDTRYGSQDPFRIRWFSHTISTPNATSSAFFLRRTESVKQSSLKKMEGLCLLSARGY